MRGTKIVGRGVDTLLLNFCYADATDKPIERELTVGLQWQLSQVQDEARTHETAMVTPWKLKGFHLYMQPKGSRGQWKWILSCTLVSIEALCSRTLFQLHGMPLLEYTQQFDRLSA